MSRFHAYSVIGIASLIVVPLSGCSIHAVRDGFDSPVPARDKPTGKYLNISRYSINGYGIRIQDEERSALISTLQQCLSNTGHYSRVRYGQSEGGDELRVDMDIRMDRSFSWWIAWPAIYPMCAYWPFQPYTATGTVKFHAKGKVGGRDLDFSAQRSVSHRQVFYGFFKTGAIEDLLSQSYGQIYMELRDRLMDSSGVWKHTQDSVAIHPIHQ